MKKLIFLLIVLLAGGGAYYRWHTAPPDRPQFRTLPVTRGDLTIGVTATGTIEPVEVVDVGAQIVGMVKSFGPDLDRPGKPIEANSHVKQDQVLAQLDDRPHRVELEKAVAGLLMAEAEVKQSRAHLDQAERNFLRAERLKTTNSAAEYENAVSQHEIAKAELAMAEAKVQQAAGVKKEAEINLDYTTIRSPIDGTVISRKVNVGQTVVGANAPSLFLLARDLSHMHVWAAVNEADISDVHLGQKVTFTVDSCRGQTFIGKVAQIRLDASQSASVVSYNVLVDVDNTEGKLMPYATAKLQFEVAHRSQVARVPDQALRWQPTWEQVTPSVRSMLTAPSGNKKTPGDEANDGDGPTVDTGVPTVWVRSEDGLVRPIPVKVGISDGIDSEIVSGDLQLQDEVVIGAVRVAKPDFVSSFVSKVIKK